MIVANVEVALRNVLRNPRRSLVALLAVSCGVAALIVASGFIAWNLRFGRESTIHSQLGHIRIVRQGYLQHGTADPFAYLLPDDPVQQRALEEVPHVMALAPRLEFSGLISLRDTTISFVGEGVAPDRERLLSRSLTIVDGHPMSRSDPLGIIVGEGLAANLGIKPGDAVVLLSNTRNGAVNGVEVHVRGTFATIAKAYDDVALRTPIDTARRLLRVSGAHTYTLLLDDTRNTDWVLRQLRKRFPGEGLQFIPWYQLADFYNKTAQLFSRQVDVVRAIIAVIIVLSISNSMMMSVLERTREIGTSMALGTRRRSILAQFLGEGVIVGLVGGAAGVAMGCLIAMVASAIGIPMPAPPGMASGYTAGVLVSWVSALQAFALAAVTALIAAGYPAWAASRMRVVDALRHNR